MTVPSTMADLSVSASGNSPDGSVDPPSALDDNIRAVASIVRRTQARGAAIASSSTVNLGATTDGEFVHITGTTTISSFGTVAAGIERTLVFDGALTLTHSSNLLCPYLTSFTTTAGDVMTWRSEGLGVWKCVSHLPASSSSERNRLGLGSAAVETIGTGDGDVGLLSTVSSRIDAAIAAIPAEIPSVSGHEGEGLVVYSGVASWGRPVKRRATVSLSGTSTGMLSSIPSNVDVAHVEIVAAQMSTNTNFHFRLGVSNTVVTSGYSSRRSYIDDDNTIGLVTETTSIISSTVASSSTTLRLSIDLYHLGGNLWAARMTGDRWGDNRQTFGNGNITLSGTLDSIFFEPESGTLTSGTAALYY